ncbi:MAG: hypothetical protein Q7S27_04780 [Nanoarchaeota archaeon]|nr:hypothetical protein [Nanoarchaeota archaeon]
MISKAGSILTLIGGIITFVISFLFLLVGIVVLSVASLYDKIGTQLAPGLIAGILILIFICLLIAGILKIYASKLMMNKKKVVKGGVIAVVTGAFTSDIFALSGGIVALVQGNN